MLAHSMGNWVTVEAFRQIKISGDLRHANKIGNVFLAAPDIDIDVFKSQMRRFGKPRKPFYIILSQDDRALFLSRTIAGGVTRVGDNPDVAELAALGATVIDLTDLKATDATNHDKFAQLAAVAPELQQRPRPGHADGSPGERRRPNRCKRSRLDRLLAAHDPRRADQDHRRPVGAGARAGGGAQDAARLRLRPPSRARLLARRERNPLARFGKASSLLGNAIAATKWRWKSGSIAVSIFSMRLTTPSISARAARLSSAMRAPVPAALPALATFARSQSGMRPSVIA